MYAWDVAVALHRNTTRIVTEHYPHSTTIVQPPFDVGLGEACMTHYTWGALYHEGRPSQGGKQVRPAGSLGGKGPLSIVCYNEFLMAVEHNDTMQHRYSSPKHLAQSDWLLLFSSLWMCWWFASAQGTRSVSNSCH